MEDKIHLDTEDQSRTESRIAAFTSNFKPFGERSTAYWTAYTPINK